MDYPYELLTKVNNIFGDIDVEITLYSEFTTFVGTNASGKTQTLKALRDKLKSELGREKVRIYPLIELVLWSSIGPKRIHIITQKLVSILETEMQALRVTKLKLLMETFLL